MTRNVRLREFRSVSGGKCLETFTSPHAGTVAGAFAPNLRIDEPSLHKDSAIPLGLVGDFALQQ
jgi:hypothetical protein